MRQDNIRNFCIIAHIDHGKSTLADRLLELTGTVEKRKMKEQMLDRMDLERERGITIKLQPVRMNYRLSRTDTDRTQTSADNKLLYEDLTYKIRGAIFEVRKKLGSGHKENIYHNALKIELQKRQIPFESEKVIDVFYEEKKVGVYKPDLMIDNKVILEIKALPYIGKPLEEQVWNYLKGTAYQLALLVNFGPSGAEIKRIIDGPKKSSVQSVTSPEESVFQLNLIDTPGHVDFTYEVSRSLAACEGAILVVDATQGIQAQTLANVHLALQHDLKIIPVVNKIDLPGAQPEETAMEVMEVFGFSDDEILFVSAKTGENVAMILESIIARIPPPKGREEDPLQALIFDSEYDKHRGVIAYVRVVNGLLGSGEKIEMMATAKKGEAIEVGYFSPEFVKSKALGAGEVGYIVTGFREVEDARVGDTVTASGRRAVSALPGYKEIKPMVYASIFPSSGDDYPMLREAMEKLKLNDASLSFEPESIPAMGFGFRTGFLGLLHMDIVQERLSREFDLDLVITSPSVAYKIKKTSGTEITVYNPAAFPDPSEIASVSEPWVALDVITPDAYMGSIMELVTKRRGEYTGTDYLGADSPGRKGSRVNLHFAVPLANIISDFYDKLKSVSSGYGSMNYELDGWREADMTKLDILVAGERADALSVIVHQSAAESEGRAIVEKLKDLLPKQQFAIALQASIGAKIIARETIPALRKDVTAKLYGGDVTRKMKLLKKQKKGKKRMRKMGKVEIPQDAFLKLMKR